MSTRQNRPAVVDDGSSTKDATGGGGDTQQSTGTVISKAKAKEIQVKLAADRLTKRRKQMNGKGVFDDNINKTRAGVMLLCETDTHGRSGKKREPDQKVLARLLGKGGNGDKGEQTKIEKLASTLDNLHSSYVNESAAGVAATRTKERHEKVRVVVGGPQPAQSNQQKQPHHPPQNQHVPAPQTTSILTSGQPKPSAGAHIAGPSIRTNSVALVESSRTTPLPEGNTKPASANPAPEGADKLTVSDWMQRNHEHQRYPEAEKDARAMLRRKDEGKRSATPVDRYTTPWLSNNPEAKNWEANSAKLSMEKTFTPASLADYRDRPDGSPARTRPTEGLDESALSTQPPNPVTGMPSDFTQTMSTHKGLLEHGAEARRARANYRETVNKELQSQQGMLAEGMQRELDPDATEVRDEDYESSNEGEEGDAFSRLFDKDGDSVTIVDELSYKHGSHTELSEACNLIECTVVCLCEEANQKARTGVTRDHAILRNILLSGLASMYPSIQTQVKKRNEDLSLKTSLQAGISKSPAPASYRHMRSWTKGVETLLLFDLGLSGVPFSIHVNEHVDLLVKYYCSLHKQKQERTQRLMNRWKKNKETEESLAFHTKQQKNEQQEAKQQLADGLLRFMQNSSAVTGDDLSALDVGSANIKYRQREVAQSFLDRFEQYLPTSEREKVKAAEKDNLQNEALDSLDPMPKFSSFDDAPPQAKSTLRLRHVLLQYVGLLSATSRLSPSLAKNHGNMSSSPAQNASVTFGGKDVPAPTAGGAPMPTTTPQAPSPSPAAIFSVAGGVSENAITQFINIFKMTWSQTPLSKEVDVSEAHERNLVMEGNRVISLIELYMGLLSPHIRDNFRFRVKGEKRRVEELERRLTEEARAFSVVVQRASGQQSQEEKELSDKVSALHDVEKKQLIEKYSKSAEDKDRLTRLKKAIESSEEWHGYNALGRIPLDQVIAENGGEDGSVSPGEGGASPGEKSTSPGAGADGGDGFKGTQAANRLEVVRIRKLRELDSCWKSLKIPYGTQIALQDKWNKALVKQVDKALRLYRECVVAVEAREGTVKAVYENEKCQDTKERTVNRHQLFSAMCAAGQVCEVAARKLQLEVEDTLMYGDAVYLVKLKEDFNQVSKLLRS